MFIGLGADIWFSFSWVGALFLDFCFLSGKYDGYLLPCRKFSAISLACSAGRFPGNACWYWNWDNGMSWGKEGWRRSLWSLGDEVKEERDHSRCSVEQFNSTSPQIFQRVFCLLHPLISLLLCYFLISDITVINPFLIY